MIFLVSTAIYEQNLIRAKEKFSSLIFMAKRFKDLVFDPIF
jgi:hypothetical protein